jgi:hypothetical protein
MSIKYKLIKIEENQPEKVVVLSEDNFDIILEAIGIYENYLEDNTPAAGDDLDLEYHTEAVNAFESANDKLMKFIHSPKLLIE